MSIHKHRNQDLEERAALPCTTELFPAAGTEKQPTCLSRDEWTKKTWYGRDDLSVREVTEAAEWSEAGE